MLDCNFFANFAIWMANIIFFISYLPQVFLNYKLKSTKGLSDLFILIGMHGQLACLAYAFSANLPMVYKVMMPLMTFSYMLLVLQRFLYSSYRTDKRILLIYLFNILIAFSIVIIAVLVYNPLGIFLGWISIFTGLWKKIPQMIKIFFAKSVEGFSLGYIAISISGYFFEMVAAFALGLPAQILFNDLRGLSIYMIFLLQFIFYNKEFLRLIKRKVLYVRSQ